MYRNTRGNLLFHILLSVFCQDAIPLLCANAPHAFLGCLPSTQGVLCAVIIGLCAVETPGQDAPGAGIIGRLGSLDDLLLPTTGDTVGLNPNIMILLIMIDRY